MTAGSWMRRSAAAAVLAASAGWPAHAAQAADPAAAAAARAAAEAAAEEEAYATGIEAFLYGYPRVEMARRIHDTTQRVAPGQVVFAPVNRFFYAGRLARPGDGLATRAPNPDMLQASAHLDLRAGPVVLHVPPMGGRHHVGLLVDAAGNVASVTGRRVAGVGGVELAFIGPEYQGPLPTGMTSLRQRANDLRLLVRVAPNGADDEPEAARLLERITLREAGQRRPERGQNADIGAQPAQAPLSPFEGLQYFAVLDRMLVRNPVPAEDRGLLRRWQRIGLGSGRFDAAQLPGPLRRGLERAVAQGRKIVAAAPHGSAGPAEGWNYADPAARRRSDWALEAALARDGHGLLATDPVHHHRQRDAAGQPLSGAKRYTITFAPGQWPPARAFWSLSAYDEPTLDLIENPLRRYAVGTRTPGLQGHADGSLTLAIQADEPADPLLRANWLPVGRGPFHLVLRTYDPAPAPAGVTWVPPQVVERR